jgi:hypothetical protein
MSARRWRLERPIPTWPQLCVLTHYVLDRVGPDAPPSDSLDELKWDCARAGFDYPAPDRLVAALEAVTAARAKGYQTPRRPTIARRAS